MGELDGKVVVISGGAVGIGNGFARVFGAQGAAVAICDIRPEVETVAGDLRLAGVDAVAWLADVRDAAQVKRFVDEAAARFGGIDMLVANAGIWRPTLCAMDSWEKAVQDWDDVVNTNLRGVFLAGRAAIPHLMARGGGHIINIATDHICPPPGSATGGGTRMDVYDSSKFGINGLTGAWSKALKQHGIRVNALCMDATDSMMVRGAVGRTPTQEMLDLWMTPEQMAGLGLDLIREGPDGRSGENIGAWLNHEVKLPPVATVLPSRHA